MRTITPLSLLSFFLISFSSPDPARSRSKEPDSAGGLKVRAERLQEEGDLGGASRALRRYLEARPEDYGAVVHLADLLSWQGYLAAARTRYEEARRLNPGSARAEERLNWINNLSAPWIRAGFSYRKDNQPLRRKEYPAELGWPLTPQRSLSLQFNPQVFTFHGSKERVLTLAAVFKDYWPALRLGVEASSGYLDRSFAEKIRWIGSLDLTWHGPAHFSLRGFARREPYLDTVFSLSTPVMTESYSGLVTWEPPSGWNGQGGYIRQRYPNDDNAISTAYGWLLAPLVHNRRYTARLGYAFGYQDADENRYIPHNINEPFLQDDLTYSYRGDYNPYYTPHNYSSHSAAAVFTVQPAEKLFFSLNSSYGFQATEDAPYLYPTGPGTFARGFYKRWFHPWKVEADLSFKLLENLRLTARFRHSDEPYFRTDYAGLEIHLRFPASLPRPI